MSDGSDKGAGAKGHLTHNKFARNRNGNERPVEMLTFSRLLSVAAESSMPTELPMVSSMLWVIASDGGCCKESNRPLNVHVHLACKEKPAR
jgi:hypothetical protein